MNIHCTQTAEFANIVNSMGAVDVPVGWRTFSIPCAESEDMNLWENIITSYVEELAQHY